ncbi:LUD domain-containing protein [Psychroflexus aestuariivivens]|uniref:LUD domain-containing protein n=1 Tax=Psychroflexus aestuariivivens TaxID=1795040 RepID=UPI000FD7A57F|nr:LUD domain-containing protein [Psychroflexus aestuariivivens]
MNFLKRLLGLETKDDENSDRNEQSKFMPEPKLPVDEAFTNNFRNNGGKFLYCENENELRITFNEILNENHWEEAEVYCHNEKLKEKFEHTRLTFSKNNNASFFLAGCEFLIANTGAILISSSQIGDKKLADLPYDFIIIAYTSQLLETIGEGLQKIKRKHKNRIPTNITTLKTFEDKEESDFMSYGSTPKNLYLLLVEDL